MRSGNRTFSNLSEEAYQRLAPMVRRFEEAWRAGPRPVLADFLPRRGDADRPVLLLELLHVDLELRVKAGDALPVVATYFRTYDAEIDRSAAIQLIAAEYDLRRQRQEPGSSLGPWLDRLPEYDAELRELFADYATEPNASPAPTAMHGNEARQATPRDVCRVRPAERYRPVRLHAKGGLGEVLVAQDEELHRMVALKRIQPRQALNEESVRRFLQEAEITARLEHPGIVPVYGLVEGEDGRPCYAMRFIEGETLQRALDRFHADKSRRDQREVRLEQRQLLARFIATCNTLAYAHSHGIVHRDLKPSNVILGKYGETLVVDWGLAKVMAESEGEASPGVRESPGSGTQPTATLTQEGSVMGTPAYMSPEQAEGRLNVCGPATDVYGLGATLYALLTGGPPFPGHDANAILAAARRGAFLPPRQRDGMTPRALEAICLKAMAFRPESRYATALELAADVERWLADEAVSAHREPWTTKARRWLRRHRVLAASVVATLAAATVFLVVLLAIFGEQNTVLRDKNRELTALSDRENAARVQADLDYHIAKEAVDKYLTAVAEDPDLNQGDFNKLRKKLLETALPYYEKFAERAHNGQLPEQERAQAHYRLAQLRVYLGESVMAWANLEESRVIYAKLLEDASSGAGDSATVATYRLNLARVHNSRGILLKELGRRNDARVALRQAVALFEELVTAFPAKPDYRQDLAMSHNNLGVLFTEEGQRAEAAQAFRAAHAAYQFLTTAYPNVRDYRRDLAMSYNNLALLWDKSHADDAESDFRHAIDIAEKLAADFPLEREYRSNLAASHNNLGNLLARLGRTDAAETSFRQAIAREQKLADDSPTVPEYRRALAAAHNNLGLLLASVGRQSEADRAYRYALTHYERLVTEFPARSAYVVQLGNCYANLGQMVRDQGQPAAALPWFDKAIQALQPVVHQEQRLAEAREFLRTARVGRALTLEQLGLRDEAGKEWDQAVDLSEGPERMALRSQRAVFLVRMGRTSHAIAEADQVAASLDPAAETLYNLACVYALASGVTKEDAKQADQHGARAIEFLRKADAAGLFKSRAQVSHLKSDTDLDALRPRPDYVKFLEKLEHP